MVEEEGGRGVESIYAVGRETPRLVGRRNFSEFLADELVGGLAVGFWVAFVGSHNVVVLVCCVNEEWAGWVSMGYCLLPVM